MATLGWAVVLPVCEQPTGNLPSDTRLHQLLVSLLDINVQVEPPPCMHACSAGEPASGHAPSAPR